MSNSKQTVQVNKIKQLIDLNGDKTNFDLSFQVRSSNNEPFDALVVSQTQLDSGADLDYKNVTNGFISGNIVSDKNVYQNYFLLLKSNNPVQCEVELSIKEIQPVLVQPPPSIPEQVLISEKQRQLNAFENNKTQNLFSWKNIITAIIIIGGVIILYYLYFQGSNSSIKSNSIINDVSSKPIIDSGELLQVSDIPVNNEILNIDNLMDSGSSGGASLTNEVLIDPPVTNFNQHLFNRLNNVKMW
jgi:hypothetical protein